METVKSPSPGFEICSRCGGTGKFETKDHLLYKCAQCEGKGEVREGTKPIEGNPEFKQDKFVKGCGVVVLAVVLCGLCLMFGTVWTSVPWPIAAVISALIIWRVVYIVTHPEKA